MIIANDAMSPNLNATGLLRGTGWHNDWLWLTFYSGYSATTTPAMMQEDAAAYVSGIVLRARNYN